MQGLRTHPLEISVNANKFVVGVDFGTLSGRAVVVRVSDGAELGSAVHEYAHGVIERELPGSGLKLGPDWALQAPQDWIDVLREAVPAALAAAGGQAGDGIGPRTDFTACTVLPATGDGTPRLAQAVAAPRRPAARRPDQRAGGPARRALAAPLRRQDLLRVAVRQGAAGPGGGPRDLRPGRAVDRGRRLDHLAAHRGGEPQHLHRRLQGDFSG